MSKRRKRRRGGKGCLCKDEDLYKPECCKDKDNIYAQRVGKIYFSPPIESFLLKEDADLILLEDNGNIVLEDGS